MSSQKYVELSLHCATALCKNYALKSWLFFLLWSWDFIICYSVRLWRCGGHNKTVELKGMLPEADSL